MPKKNSVTKNTVFNIISGVFKVVFPMITVPYISRILGPAKLGEVTFIRGIIFYFTSIAGLGINHYATREISKVQNDLIGRSKTFLELQLLHLFTKLPTLIIYYILIFTFPQIVKGNVKLASILGLLIFTSYFIIDWYFKGIEKFDIIYKTMLIGRLIYLPLIFLLVKSPHDIYKYAVIIILVEAITHISEIFIGSKSISFAVLKNVKLKITRHIKYVSWFFFSQLAVLVYTRLDLVMIGYLITEEAVGHYYSANRLVRLILPLVTSAGAVLLARISHMKEIGDMEGIKSYLKKSISVVLLVAIPAVVGLFLLSDQIILMIFGNEFHSSLTLKILSFLLIIVGLNNIYGLQVLLAFDREKAYSIIISIGAVINFILNMILIRSMGYNGAAISTVIAEIIILILEYFMVRKIIKELYNFKSVVQILISVLVMGLFVYLSIGFFIKGLGLLLGVILLIIAASIIYFAVLYFFQNESFLWLLREKVLKKININKK